MEANFNTNIDLNEIDNHIQILEQCIENQIELEQTSVSNKYEPQLLKMIKRYRINKYQVELDMWREIKQIKER